MHLVGWLPEKLNDIQVAEAARQHGVYVRPLSWQSLRKRYRPGLVLGFAATTPAEIRQGVEGLSRAIRACM